MLHFNKSLDLLSRLLLPRKPVSTGPALFSDELEQAVLQISRTDFDALASLADTNHVLVRALENFGKITLKAGDETRTNWATDCLFRERARIDNAISFLRQITDALTNAQFSTVVIKSLDHLPDLGSDLDLYTNARSNDVIDVMRAVFEASLAQRSWGDRLVCKWNFILPGLPELVEIHIGRLGQTGEQFAIAASLIDRTRCITVRDHQFRVPSISDRLIISTLQRMYRHFYFRLCDIVDSAQLIDERLVDYNDLYVAAMTAGIWEGMATYLAIVSDYVHRFRGEPLDIPGWVFKSARFSGQQIYFAKNFLRVPIVPQSAGLYGSQLVGLLRRKQLQSGARLSLLPWLATAALVGQKITGNDKGIW
jgi:hypothetical protein